MSPKAQTHRTFWHPYADDAPDAIIEVTGVSRWDELADRVPDLEGKSEWGGAGLMFIAITTRGPFNSPALGCIFHTPE